MKAPDYEAARAKVMGMNTHAERPWMLLAGIEKVEYGTMPALPEQALLTVLGARRARPLAQSYRDFSVGACAMVEREGNAIAMNYGVNMKSSSGASEVDLHAEEAILKSLRSGDRVTCLAVAAPPQPDQGTGLDSLTLHPCTYRCQPLMQESEHVDARTLLVCNLADGTALEWGTLDDFRRFHEGEADALTSATFGELPEVLRPLPPADYYVLGEQEIDTAEWDAKVTFPLMGWDRGQHGRPKAISD